MADVHPFRAFRYDPRQASPARVVTQPYDKITPELQDRYYEASPHNLVRIILGRREENDNAVNNVYSRAAGIFATGVGKAFCARILILRSIFIPSASPCPVLARFNQ